MQCVFLPTTLLFIYAESMQSIPTSTILEPTIATAITILKTQLSQRDIESYIMGGFVRNIMLGIPKYDLDIVVREDALVIGTKLAEALTAHFVVLDDVNRVVRLLPRYDGNWQIDLATMQGQLEQDMLRRDFSINAFAINLSEIILQNDVLTATVLDNSTGLEDIKNKIIRMVSPLAFAADPIRLLRGVRLAGELGFDIEPQTYAKMQCEQALIKTVAAERIRDELLRIFALCNTGAALDLLIRLGLLTTIIPELLPSVGLEQSPEHTWDVFQHSVQSVTALDYLLHYGAWNYYQVPNPQNIPWDESTQAYFAEAVSAPSTRRSLCKLAALLHDIAKPQTRIINKTGRIRFYGHPQKGAEVVISILERLRFSQREIKFMQNIVRHHLRPVQMSENGALPTRRAIYRYRRDLEEAGIATLYFSLADHLATRGPNLEIKDWDRHLEDVRFIMRDYSNNHNLPQLPNILNGTIIQKELGIKPGKELGRILEELNEAQVAGEFETREQGLEYARKLMACPSLGSNP